MGSEAVDPLHIVAEATRRASRSAGESREGAALFGGGLGDPPNPYPLRFPPGNRADLRSRDGRPYEYGAELLADLVETGAVVTLIWPVRLTDIPILRRRRHGGHERADVLSLTRIHRRTSLGTALEEAGGCPSESGIMVLEQKPPGNKEHPIDAATEQTRPYPHPL